MSTGSNITSRPRLIGIVLLVATFVAGGFSGAALERRANSKPPAPEPQVKAQPAERATGGGRAHGHQSSIIDQLDLTATQRATIDSILQDGREKLNAFWKETGPGYHSLVDSTRARVRAVMTPEQQVRYDELRAARRARSRNGEANGANPANGKAGYDNHGEGGDQMERQGATKESGAR